MTDERSRRRPGIDTGLRTAAVWDVLDDVVAARSAALGRPLRVLDLGGGTGGFAVPLARAGHDVLVIDPSPDALASLRHRVAEAGSSPQADHGLRLAAVQGDADSLPEIVEPASFDLVCCHGTLEHLEDPHAALANIARALAPHGLLSVLAAGRLAAVLSRTIAGDFAGALHVLTSEDGRWGSGDPVTRRFEESQLRRLLCEHGFATVRAHGVRIFSDLVPSALVDSEADRAALLALETRAADHPDHPELGALGAAIHLVATHD